MYTSPYCQPYNSFDVSSENLVLDQLIIPKFIFFLTLITYLINWYCIDIVRKNSVLVTHRSLRVKGTMTIIQDKVYRTYIYHPPPPDKSIKRHSRHLSVKGLRRVCLTLYTLTSACIFSILFSIHFLRCWRGELA